MGYRAPKDMLMKKLAIIKDVGYGNRDVGSPVLWFSAYTAEGVGSLQVFYKEEANEIIKDTGVYDVHDLEGKPCWVDERGLNMKFIKMAHI